MKLNPRAVLPLVLCVPFVLYSNDSVGTPKKKTCGSKTVAVRYKGYTFKDTGSLFLQEPRPEGRRVAPGDFQSLALDTASPNAKQVLASFPSLRDTAALETYLADEKKGVSSLFKISGFFPAPTKSLLDELACRRANCMVAALAWFGLTDNLDLFHEEFSNLLKANFEQIKPTAAGTPIPPETMVTWCGKGSDTWVASHAAVYLGDGLVWHKFSGNLPAYTSLKNVMNQYGVAGARDDRAEMRFFKRRNGFE